MAAKRRKQFEPRINTDKHGYFAAKSAKISRPADDNSPSPRWGGLSRLGFEPFGKWRKGFASGKGREAD
jgi:hypothetical protein